VGRVKLKLLKMKKVMLTAFAVGLCLAANVMAQVPSYVPTNGLVGYWPFNGNANDESGNGNNGTVTGATMTTDRFGSSNKAYSFDGVNDGISCSPISISGTSSRSINFWYKETNGISSGNTAFSWGSPTQGNRFDCGLSPTGIFVGAANSAKGFSYIALSTNWNMYTVVLPIVNNPTVNDIIVYQNGIQLTNILTNLNVSTVINTSPNQPLNFGKNNEPTNQAHLTGNLDDIGIWNRALTQQEITVLYNSCTGNEITSQPTNAVNTIGTNAQFSLNAVAGSTYQWQSNPSNFGWQNVPSNANYSGGTSNSLTVSNVQLSNHNQPFRVIASAGNCTDTSNVASILIADTCITNVTVYDTLYTTVTDTLIINTTLGLPAPNNENTILIYPNPASDHITIDNGNYTAMAGYTIKIENNAGQQVFQSLINQAQFYVDLSTWSGNGLYFVHLIDAQGNTVTVRKIVLQ
jgi:hypothetical protein